MYEAVEQSRREPGEGEGEATVMKLNAGAPYSHRERCHGYGLILASKDIFSDPVQRKKTRKKTFLIWGDMINTR